MKGTQTQLKEDTFLARWNPHYRVYQAVTGYLVGRSRPEGREDTEKEAGLRRSLKIALRSET